MKEKKKNGIRKKKGLRRNGGWIKRNRKREE